MYGTNILKSVRYRMEQMCACVMGPTPLHILKPYGTVGILPPSLLKDIIIYEKHMHVQEKIYKST